MHKIDRSILAKFLPNPQAVVQFENIQNTTVQNESDVKAALDNAAAAQQAADKAQGAADAAKVIADQAAGDIVSIKSGSGAGQIGVTPAGGIQSQNVQAALVELDTEKTSAATLAATGGAALVGAQPSGNLAGATVQAGLFELDKNDGAGLRNLVLNGAFNINQRKYVSGATTIGPNQYSLDMWRVVVAGQSVTFSGGVATAPAGGLEQVIEGACITQTIHTVSWAGNAACTVDGLAVTKGAQVTLTPGTNCTLRFSGGTVTQATLEPGKVAHPFEPRPPSLELWLCQRYAFGWSSLGAVGVCNGGGGDFGVIFPNTMRASPTFTLNGAPTFVDGTATISASGLILISSDGRGARIFFSASGTTAGRAAVFNGDGFGVFSCNY
jgi:hypothetical protein